MGAGNDKKTQLVTSGVLKWDRTVPLVISWNPKEDITPWELAQCQYIIILMAKGPVMPAWIDQEQTYMRHFKITDLNK